MRKITENIADAFMSHEPKAQGNSSTDGKALFLHGNLIAWHGTHEGREGIFLTLAGWNTSTTKERLRGVLRMMGHLGSVGISTCKGQTWIGNLHLDPDSVVFVAHPCHARGLDAVTLVEEEAV